MPRPLAGGLAEKRPGVKICPRQLAMGVKVEMEHTRDPKVAEEIARDHLVEIPDYYTRLKEMESEAFKAGVKVAFMNSMLLDVAAHDMSGHDPKFRPLFRRLAVDGPDARRRRSPRMRTMKR